MTTAIRTAIDRTVVAVYGNHAAAEDAVRRLQHAGFAMDRLSIVGRDFQLHQDVEGYYRPADAALEGAGEGAWVGGIFGTLLGFGFFLVPVVGPFFALGPLAGLIAGAIGGAGVGALIGALTTLGVPRDQALKYQSRLQAGEFLVIIEGTAEEADRAREALSGSGEIEITTHQRPAA